MKRKVPFGLLLLLLVSGITALTGIGDKDAEKIISEEINAVEVSQTVLQNSSEKSDGYVNVREYGCKYDGITDDSAIILSIDSDYLYFPTGEIVIDSKTAKTIMSKNIKGEGLIRIKDYFIFWNSKYPYSGMLYADDFNNMYIASLNLPNEAVIDTDYTHQKNTGWINDNTVTSPDYETFSLTCWGQVFPTVDSTYDDEDMITINLGKMSFGYYDEVSGSWIMKEKVPEIYGLYCSNFKKLGMKGKDYSNSEMLTVTNHVGYVSVTFKYKYIKDRMLHYGWTTKDIPVDRELYVKGNQPIWLTDNTHPDSFASNIGFDFRAYENGEVKIKEYCGSRSLIISDKVRDICLGYVENRYDLLR